MYIVAVQFEIDPKFIAEFREAILINAAASVNAEPDCHQFDVGFNDDGTKCFLYEVYTDEAAFGEHRASPHFAKFSQAIDGKIINKQLEIYHLAENPHVK